MADFKEKWEAYSPQKQKLMQIVTGILLSLLSLFFLFIPIFDFKDFVNFSLILAIIPVIIGPRYLEKLTGSRLKLLQISMLISMFVGLAIMAACLFIFNIPIKA